MTGRSHGAPWLNRAGLCVLALLLSTDASAQGSAPATQKHEEQGKRLFAQKKYREAAAQFEHAALAQQENAYIYHFNAGLCYERLARPRKAMTAYKQAAKQIRTRLRTHDSCLPELEKSRAELSRVSRRTEKRISAVEETLARERELAKKARGLWKIRAVRQAEERASMSRMLSINTRRPSRRWTWVATGGALALGSAALVTGILTSMRYDQLDGERAHSTQADYDSAKDLALATDALIVSASVTAVAAVVLYFLEGKQYRTR